MEAYSILIGKVADKLLVIDGPSVDTDGLDKQFSALVDAGGETQIGKKDVVVSEVHLMHSRKGVLRDRKNLPSLKAPAAKKAPAKPKDD